MESRDSKELSPAAVYVMCVGGAGGNAVNSMIKSSDCPNVKFIAANTDIQALEQSLAEVKIQLGSKTTKGLGAGSNPDAGRRAAEEDIEEIKKHISGADILFLAGGMGGGTASGALPVIAKAAKEMGILTVAVVTKPFNFEGKRRAKFAEEAIQSLKSCIDTMIIVPNQKLLAVADPKISMLDAFGMSNNVLKQAVKGISDIIQKTGLVNVDFADVRTIMKEMGFAIMGTGRASGPERAKKATMEAINSPLLENINIEGAKGILFNVTGNKDLGLYEINDAAQIVYGLVSDDANIILGSVIDESLTDEIVVTLIATGLCYETKEDFTAQSQGQESSRVHYAFKQDAFAEVEKSPALLKSTENTGLNKHASAENSEKKDADKPFSFFN